MPINRMAWRHSRPIPAGIHPEAARDISPAIAKRDAFICGKLQETAWGRMAPVLGMIAALQYVSELTEKHEHSEPCAPS